MLLLDCSFRWSTNGPIRGLKCLQWYNPIMATRNLWQNNYLCAPQYPKPIRCKLTFLCLFEKRFDLVLVQGKKSMFAFVQLGGTFILNNRFIFCLHNLQTAQISVKSLLVGNTIYDKNMNMQIWTETVVFVYRTWFIGIKTKNKLIMITQIAVSVCYEA